MISQARVVIVGVAFAKVGTQFEVEVLEDRRKATVLESEPAYDPANERLRA
jgi:glycine cleavage system aminomethyltransferase T